MDRRVVWITGGSSGIGRACALEMASAGWVVGLGSRRLEILERNVADLPGADSHAAASLDLCSEESVGRWAANLKGRTGSPDLLVYSAGWGAFAPVLDLGLAEFERTIATNLTGMFLVARTLLPEMLERGSGHFIHILSVASRQAFANNAAYNASKYGALGFTEAMREEVRSRGIRVTALLPGATDTPLWDRMPGEWDRSRMIRPETVARAVRQIAETPGDALCEEVRLAPPGGNL